MSANFFLDTNILVYSFDASQPEKRDCALRLIGDALQNGHGVISTQVVQEFLNVATRKFVTPLQGEECKMYLRTVLSPLCQVFPDTHLFEISLDILNEARISFYDALIVAGALVGGCEILYSEDLQAGQQFRQVTIINPFSNKP